MGTVLGPEVFHLLFAVAGAGLTVLVRYLASAPVSPTPPAVPAGPVTLGIPSSNDLPGELLYVLTHLQGLKKVADGKGMLIQLLAHLADAPAPAQVPVPVPK